MRPFKVVFREVHFGGIHGHLLITMKRCVRVSFLSLMCLLRIRSRRVGERGGFGGGFFVRLIDLAGLGFLAVVLRLRVF